MSAAADKQFTTLAEIAEAINKTKSTVSRMSAAGRWGFIEEKLGGRPLKRFTLSKLPKEIRSAVLQARGEKILTQVSNPSEAMQAFTQANPLLLLTLSDRQKKVEGARQLVLNELERMHDNGLSQEEAIRTLLSMAKLEALDANMLQALKLGNDKGGGDKLPSARTLKRWKSADKHQALAPKKREKDYTWPEWADEILALYRRPQKPSLQAVVAQYRALNEDGPSYHVAWRWLQKLPAVEREKGRMGPRELKNIKPFVRRTFEELWPNDVWSADGHTFDAEVSHPLHGQPFRPEITGIIDIGTRYLTGFSVTLAESALTTVDALRSACEACGIPAIFYVDNGSGYANHLLKDEAIGLFGRLGIEAQHSLPYNSQARGVIERVHRSIWVGLAKTLDSFIGADMDREAAQQFHKLSRRGDKDGVLKMAISWHRFMQLAEDAVSEYNHRPHSSLPKFNDANGKRRHYSPAEYRALKMQAEDYEQHDIDPALAAALFRPRVVRKALRGEVSLFSNKYFSKALETFHGEDIQVGYDVHDAQHVWLYDEDGVFIDRAEFMGNGQSYFAPTVIEMARDKRADAALKRLDVKRDRVEAERTGTMALEAIPANELPGMEVIARKIEERTPAEMAPTIPQDDRERYRFCRSWLERAAAGEEIPEGLRMFMESYPKTAKYRAMDKFYNPQVAEESQ